MNFLLCFIFFKSLFIRGLSYLLWMFFYSICYQCMIWKNKLQIYRNLNRSIWTLHNWTVYSPSQDFSRATHRRAASSPPCRWCTRCLPAPAPQPWGPGTACSCCGWHAATGCCPSVPSWTLWGRVRVCVCAQKEKINRGRGWSLRHEAKQLL